MRLLKAYLHDFWRYRYLLINLISRDFKLKYRRSVLGVAWSVLNPLLMNIVMVIVFSTIMDMRGTGIENFPVYLLIGQLLFNFFTDGTSSAMSSMLSAAPLIKKVYIPKYIFPLERVCFSLVNCLLSFVALILMMIITGARLHATVFLALYPLGTLFLFTLGVGLILSAATVFFRDVMHLWSVFTTALMYFSAIFYDPLQMGSFTIGSLSLNVSQAIRFNPLYWYITGFRTTVLNGRPLTWSMIWICGLCSVLALGAGLLVFRRQQDKFVLHI